MVRSPQAQAGEEGPSSEPPTRRRTMKESMALQFSGDLPVWGAFALALGAAAFVFWLYRMETKRRGDRYGWQLPLLRATAVFLAAFILAGPVLHHERVIRELGRLFVFVDDSDSMALTDEQMLPERKIAALQTLGELPREESMKFLDAAAAQLARAHTSAQLAMRGGAEFPLAGGRLEDVVTHLEEALKSMQLADLDLDRLSAPSRGFVRMDVWRGGDRFEVFDNTTRRKESMARPDATRFFEGFAIPTTEATNFTAWLRGYFVAPETGKYTFWIASDDRSMLLISRDANPSRSKEVARVEGYVDAGKFDEKPRQESRKLPMKKGEWHFIEAVLEAGPGENHLSVAWAKEGGKRQILGGQELIAWAEDGTGKDGESDGAESFVQGVLAEAVDLQELSTSDEGVNPLDFSRRLKSLAVNVGRMRERLRDYLQYRAADYLARHRESELTTSKLEEFSQWNRRDRMTRLLLDESTGLLPRLKENQDVELFVLSGNRADEWWWQRR
ncbi:MAG: PA14 domain-containing protein, partial [Verrucomicrobiota bacterium]